MEQGYFAAAWADIKNSEGWISKTLLLTLLFCIPIFGPIVVYGYLYGWTREMAWNIHKPLPARIFGNEDGQLYRRGGFIFLVGLIVVLVAQLLALPSNVSSVQELNNLSNYAVHPTYASGLDVSVSYSPLGIFGAFGNVLSLAVSVFGAFWLMLAACRVCMYNTLGSAFEFKQLWAMFRYDGMGLLRIFGIVLLVGVIGVVISLFALVPAAMFIGMAVLEAFASAFTMTAPDINPAWVPIGTLLAVIGAFILQLANVFATMLQARALGYWLRQFEVAEWGASTDPLPFQRKGYTNAAQVRSVQQHQAWSGNYQPMPTQTYSPTPTQAPTPMQTPTQAPEQKSDLQDTETHD